MMQIGMENLATEAELESLQRLPSKDLMNKTEMVRDCLKCHERMQLGRATY